MSDAVEGGHGTRSDSPGEARGLRFEMLGPLRVVRAGEVVNLGGPQQRAVLALLLIDSDPPVSVARLANALWGERPPHASAATIQTYVFHLREALEPDRARGARARVLVTDRGGYRLDARALRRRRPRIRRVGARGESTASERGDVEQALGEPRDRARTLARGRAGRRRRTGGGRAGGGPVVRAAAERDRGADRCVAGARSARARDRRARRTDRAAPAARAPARAADARAVPLRAAGRRTRGISPGAPRPRRGDRGRAVPGTARAAPRDPRPRPRAFSRIRRQRRAPTPAPRSSTRSKPLRGPGTGGTVVGRDNRRGRRSSRWSPRPPWS